MKIQGDFDDYSSKRFLFNESRILLLYHHRVLLSQMIQMISLLSPSYHGLSFFFPTGLLDKETTQLVFRIGFYFGTLNVQHTRRDKAGSDMAFIGK
jgi:hypothetical protein